MGKSAGLRLDSDFTEDIVGFAIESFLSVLSFPRYRFSIEPFSRGKERWLGADARLLAQLKGFRPFYMQFKRPSGYPDYSTAAVVKERKNLRLAVTPRSLYFSLREKQATHHDYQHNVLLRLRKRLLARGLGDATYVCPLFLDRAAYRLHVHAAGLRGRLAFWRREPWRLEDLSIVSGSSGIRFDRVPLLAEHISIPAHEVVANAKHSYSFTESGTDLCFHSPVALPDGAASLGSFLTGVSTGIANGDSLITPERAARALEDLIAGGPNSEPVPEGRQYLKMDDPISGWLSWGDLLKRDYGIEQFAVMSWTQ
jgi:hypothetical protein